MQTLTFHLSCWELYIYMNCKRVRRQTQNLKTRTTVWVHNSVLGHWCSGWHLNRRHTLGRRTEHTIKFRSVCLWVCCYQRTMKQGVSYLMDTFQDKGRPIWSTKSTHNWWLTVYTYEGTFKTASVTGSECGHSTCSEPVSPLERPFTEESYRTMELFPQRNTVYIRLMLLLIRFVPQL